VTTNADAYVEQGKMAKDTATLTGGEIVKGMKVRFNLFFVPEGSTLAGDARCSQETKVNLTDDMTVEAARSVQSPAVVVDKLGDYYWVEELLGPDGSVLSTGKCGAENEVTKTYDISTIASDEQLTLPVPDKDGKVSVKGQDRVIVNGQVPAGAKARVKAYYTKSFGPFEGAPLPYCTKANLVGTSKTFDVPKAGQYDSSEFTFTKAGTYFYVEELLNSAGDVIASGECGAANEQTTVLPNVRTIASANTVTVGAEGYDTVLVTGFEADKSTSGSYVTVDLFQVSDDTTAPADSCTQENKVWTSEKIAVTKSGSYDTNKYTYATEGTYYYVETLYIVNGSTQVYTVTGACGVPDETVVVTPETTPPTPSDTPSTPSDTPSTPSDTPSTPSDTPSTPSDTPSTPSDTPSTPSDTPSTPSDTPSTPSDTPSTPSDTPSTPSDTPSTPSTTPPSPSDTPSTSVPQSTPPASTTPATPGPSTKPAPSTTAPSTKPAPSTTAPAAPGAPGGNVEQPAAPADNQGGDQGTLANTGASDGLGWLAGAGIGLLVIGLALVIGYVRRKKVTV
jgi:LPXTG-motif cell wall-anchored protein